MHAMVQLILFQTLTQPIDHTTFPTGYDFLHNSALEYSVEYRWQDARNVVLTNRPVEGPERQSVLTLGEDFHLLRESTKRGDTLAITAEYQYAGGKLRTVRTPQTSQSLHYRGELLDSIAVTADDTLEEYTKYTYDSQGQLIQTDHFYDRYDSSFSEHRRRRFAYFLPDSIVIDSRYFRGPGDSSRATLYLSGERPVRMVEVEHSEFDGYTDIHIWKYSDIASIQRRGMQQRPHEFHGNRIPGSIDLNGRRMKAGKSATLAASR